MQILFTDAYKSTISCNYYQFSRFSNVKNFCNIIDKKKISATKI